MLTLRRVLAVSLAGALAMLAMLAMVLLLGPDSGGDGREPAADDTTGTHNPIADQLAAMRDPAVPDLPFDDNPDPSQCGIPQVWGRDDPAWVTGYYEGELIQATVLFYNSHSRLSITGGAAHGTPVEVVMFQANPVLNYYLVRVPDTQNAEGGPNEGWVPAPFLSFEPVAPLAGRAPEGAATD